MFAGPDIGPSDGGTVNGSKLRVGEVANLGLFGFDPHTNRTVHVRAVRVTGVPRGMRVLAVRAVDHHRYPLVGGEKGDVEDLEPPWGPIHTSPVTAMTFRKSEHDPEGWYVLVTATATKPGTWTSTGIDVEWTSGWWRRGTTHYDYRVSLIASP